MSNRALYLLSTWAMHKLVQDATESCQIIINVNKKYHITAGEVTQLVSRRIMLVAHLHK